MEEFEMTETPNETPSVADNTEQIKVIEKDLIGFSESAALLAQVISRKQRSRTQRTVMAIVYTVALFCGGIIGATTTSACLQASAKIGYCKIVPGYSSRKNYGAANNAIVKKTLEQINDTNNRQKIVAQNILDIKALLSKVVSTK